MVMITEYIFMIIMGWCIGYLSHKGIRAYKKNRKEELLDKKNLDWQNKIRDRIIDDHRNYHVTNTQGPPRRSPSHFHMEASLEDLLKIAIKNENYEYAAKLRDRIKQQNEKTP